MFIKRQIKICIVTGLIFASCESTGKDKQEKEKEVLAASQPIVKTNSDSIIYQTDNLVIRKLSNHIFQHQSFMNTTDFGKVACNGMIVLKDNEMIIFDTPAGHSSSQELVDYANNLQCKIKAVIPTHFHEDCVAGLELFQKYNIPTHASHQTISLLKGKGNKFSEKIKGFDNRLEMEVGDSKVYASYLGEGHTRDNIVGYFPADKAVFGGCLIKETGAGKGNLADANVAAWPATVRKLNETYPAAQIVIPGHGKPGGIELFDYTIKLFEETQP